MTDLTCISITSTAEGALKKLKKANIGVYDCKKRGTAFIFSVKDKDIKKAFAIFAKPCYNINVIGESKKNRLISRLVARIGLAIGAALFVAVAVVSNSFVFKISVSGSGSYLSPEVKRIIYETGAKEFSLLKGFDYPSATGKILALPQVTFCNIEKRGGVLCVDVQVDSEHSGSAKRDSLISDRSGKVRTIVAICGTPAVSVGDRVEKGDSLIYPYSFTEEVKYDCLAVGYAELECSGSFEYFAYAENDESLKAAYSSVLLYADNVLNRTHTVKPADGGVIYVIDFTYLQKLSINME